MLIILGFSLVILLPIFAYLLHPLSSHKSHVFLITFFLFGGFTFNFVSNKPIFGSWKLSYQSDSMREIIDKNVEFPNKVTTELIFSQHSHEESFLIGTEIFYQSLDKNSLVSAESILKFLNKSFSDPQFQVPIYNLLADLRDAKYPLISSSQILISIEQPSFCNLDRLEVEISIPNGPDVDIANKTIFMPDFSQQFSLNGSDAVIKGFDIPSAFLNQEMIKIALSAYCKNLTFFSMKVLDLKYSKDYQEEVFIYSNEWLKKEQ